MKCLIVHEVRPVFPNQTYGPMGGVSVCQIHGIELIYMIDDGRCPIGKLEDRVEVLEEELRKRQTGAI